ncbi:tumor necrosis factor receptor superfamily member 6-like [Enoplosus armatus]|uniref:tumor necrosis factor receptor superfamily member 6-like n=1 Tax=Enoplosus armatus TaxID=215367 RepID=UPI00399620A3
MMQLLCYFAFTSLCTLSFLSPVLSIQCNATQYAWPVNPPHSLCCNKCPPGQRMVRRSKSNCDIECEPCEGNRYTDTYNVDLSCNVCENCNKQNMEYESKCDTTHKAVCRCKAGYECRDQPCTQCVPMIISTTTALKPGTLTTLWVPPKPVRDTVWLLVIIAFLCAGSALIVVTKIKPFLRWVRSKHGYLLAEKPAPVPPFSQDDDVSTPVQEVCGKCDQPLDV